MKTILSDKIKCIYDIGNNKYLFCIDENNQIIYDNTNNKIVKKFNNIMRITGGFYKKLSYDSYGFNSLVELNNNYYNFICDSSLNYIILNIIKIDGNTFEYKKYDSQKYSSYSQKLTPYCEKIQGVKNTFIISYHIYDNNDQKQYYIVLLGTKFNNIEQYCGNLNQITTDGKKIVIHETNNNKYLIYDSIETKLLYSIDNIGFINNFMIYDRNNNEIIKFGDSGNTGNLINIKFDNKNIYLTAIRNIFDTYECVISDCPSSKLFNTIDKLYDGISDALNNLNNLSHEIIENENEIILIINYEHKYLKEEYKFILIRTNLDRISILEQKVNYLLNYN